MKLTHFILALCVAAILGMSTMLIPDKEQLTYTAENKDHERKDQAVIVAERQAKLEAQIEQEGLVAQTVSELTDSYVAAGQTDKAIALMERYHAKEPKHIEMLDKLAVIYHVAGQEENYIRILEEENELLPSVNTCYILQAYYSRMYGEDKHPEKTVRVLRHLIKLQPEVIQNYKNLIFFLFKAGKGQEVIEVVHTFRARFPDQVDYGFMFPLVDQLIKQGYYEQAYQEAEPWARKNPEPSLIDFATMFVNAGRPDLAMKLLGDEQELVKNNAYLFTVKVKATLAESPTRALQLATEWMKQHPDDLKMLEDLGNIFFAAGCQQYVIPLYEPHKTQVFANRKLLDIYRESLLVAVKNNPEYLPKLTEIYQRELDDPKTTPERRKSLVIALQDVGAVKVALDYAEKYAFSYRKEWVAMYEAMLKKQGDKKRLADFRFRYVHTMPLTQQEKRYFLSVYMEQDNKLEIERLLWDLAQGQPAKSRDVQDLVYIWGVNPEPKQLAWIEKRAMAAKGQEKEEWLNILSNIGAYESIIRVASAVPPEERSMALLGRYFDALRLSGNDSVLKAEVATGLDEEQTEPRLELYARTAREMGMFKPAAKGYDRLNGMNPDNLEYMKERGMISYFEGDVEAATQCLDAYYGAGGDDVLAVFYFAELLQQRNTQQAKPLFEQTLMLMEQKPELTVQERVLKIHTLGRLHRFNEGLDEMDKLLAEYPENDQLKLDGVEFLIDIGAYGDAEEALDRHRGIQKKTAPSLLWRLNRTHMLRTEVRSRPNELLIVFDRRTDKMPLIKRWQEHHPDWIAGVHPGYDTLLIVAQPGKKLSTTTEGINLILEATELPAAVQSAEDNFAIRHELLYARLEQETHRPRQAIDRLETLMARHPNTVSVISGLSIAKRAYGQRLQAMDLAERAHTLEPDNHWVNIMLADMRKVDEPYIRGDAQLMHMENNTQFTTRASGMDTINRNWKIAGMVENNFYHFKDLRRANGAIRTQGGASQRGQVDAIFESEEGPISTTSLYLNPGAQLGVGEHVKLHNSYGPMMAYLEYHRSDWTFVERIPDEVVRDRVGLAQIFSPKPDIFSTVGVFLTRYNQNNKDDATRSISLTGNINAPVSRLNSAWTDPSYIVGYGLDAEYVTASKWALSPFTGDYYRLYPLISREVHFVNLTYRKSFSTSLVGSLTGSYAYNRLNNQHGPIIAGELTKQINKQWEMQLRASYGTNFTRGSSGMLTTGGYLVRKFQPERD